MSLHSSRRLWLILAIAAWLQPTGVFAGTEPALTIEQIKHFLLTAKVVNSRHTGKGVTSSWRLTLSDGTLTHDAAFQSIDEHKAMEHFTMGPEMNFVDSYKYNIAAYLLAELLGLDDMVPVYVERTWRGMRGSLGWWVPVQMDESERVRRKVNPPDIAAWNRQTRKIRLLDELVYDTDPNLTNVLIGPDWRVYRIDFTRAFRLQESPPHPGILLHCDRQLFEKLKALDKRELERRTEHYLNKKEVQALLSRRDKIVSHFQELIRENGEDEVLY